MPKHFTAKKIFDEAMKAGYVRVRINTVLLFGMAGAGKTSTMHLLLGLPPPEKRNSTSVTDSAKPINVRDVSEMKIQLNESSWKQVTLEDMKKLTCDILHRIYPIPPPELKTKLKQLSEHSPTLTTIVPLSSDRQNESHSDTTIVVNKPADEIQDLPSLDNKFDSHSDTVLSTVELASEIQTLSAKNLTTSEEEILCCNLVYVIDSGGQPQFHNLLPLFVQGISTAVYILDLNYWPNDYPLIKYFKEGEELGKECQSNLTNAENFRYLIQSIKSLSNQCRLVCIGTHADETDRKKIEKNNHRMLKLLPKHFKDSEKCKYKNGMENELIFPIDTLVKEKLNREKLAKELQNVIWPPIGKFEECIFKEIKVPAWWYFLEIMLKTQFDGRKILHYSECKQVANKLNFHEAALIEALKFFHEHHIFHYYDFLPHVVFCDTQVLLDKVAEIVEYAASSITDGRGLLLAKEGKITVEILKSDKLAKHYIPNLFEPKDLIAIFENLWIITEIRGSSVSEEKQESDRKQYLMPATLDILSEAKLNNYRVFSSSIAPLLIYFKSEFIKCGVFCCLQVHLLRSPDWELYEDSNPKQNCIIYRVDTFLVTVMNSHNCVEIHIDPCIPHSDVYPKFCFEVKKLILECLKQAYKHLGYDTVDDTEFGFFCACKDTNNHQESTCSQVAFIKNKFLACKRYAKHCTKIEDKHKVWFKYGKS